MVYKIIFCYSHMKNKWALFISQLYFGGPKKYIYFPTYWTPILHDDDDIVHAQKSVQTNGFFG